MTKFKCKISDLQTIVKLVESKGKNIDGKEYQAIADCIITATKNSLKVKAMDIQKTFAVSVEYKNIDVQEQGDLAIGDLTNFRTILKRFESSDDVNVYTEENKAVISRDSPKKSAKVPLVDPEAISSMPVPPIDNLKRTENGYPATDKMKFDLKIVTTAEAISSIFLDGNAIKERILPFKIENEQISITIGSEIYGSFEVKILPESIEGPMHKTKTAFGNGLDNIFSNLTGKVNIYLVDNAETGLLCVEQDNEKFSYTALLAPYVLRD